MLSIGSTTMPLVKSTPGSITLAVRLGMAISGSLTSGSSGQVRCGATRAQPRRGIFQFMFKASAVVFSNCKNSTKSTKQNHFPPFFVIVIEREILKLGWASSGVNIFSTALAVVQDYCQRIGLVQI